MATTVKDSSERRRQGEKHTKKALTIKKHTYLVFFSSQTQTKTKKELKKNKHLPTRGGRRLTSIDGNDDQWTVDDRRWWALRERDIRGKKRIDERRMRNFLRSSNF